MHVVLLVVICCSGNVARKNPFKALVTMLPAYMTALGTQSSAATIPVTLAQTIKNGVREEVAGFVIPLCAIYTLPAVFLRSWSCLCHIA